MSLSERLQKFADRPRRADAQNLLDMDFDALDSAMTDVAEYASEVKDAIETWVDEDTETEDRAEARETFIEQIEYLRDAIAELEAALR